MNLYLIAPFTTNIRFDRKWIAYKPEKVDAYFRTVSESFAVEEISLGNWLLPRQEHGRFYLDTEEPGEMFRSYFLAESQISLPPIIFPNRYPWLSTMNSIAPSKLHVQWLDRGFGCLFATLAIDDDLIRAASEATLRDFDRSLNELADIFYAAIFSKLQQQTRRLKSISYIQVLPVETCQTKPSECISKNLLWVHKVWSLPSDANISRYSNLISSQTLTKFLAPNTSSVWGWGDSILASEDAIQADHSNSLGLPDWLRGMLLAQYFHTVLDQSLKQLPVQIEKIRLLILRGSVGRAQAEAEEYSYSINTILADFEIAKQLTAGQTRTVMISLISRWQTLNLSEGISRLLPYLKELTTQSRERLMSWKQTSIETILFVSAVVGFFGLSIALHDYLTPTKERFETTSLATPHFVVTDPLAIAGIFFLTSLGIFLLSKTGAILKVFMETRHLARLAAKALSAVVRKD